METLLPNQLPLCLRSIKPPIKRIHTLGNTNLLEPTTLRLAIVGTRHPTDYGYRVIAKIIPELIDHGICIVSGLMYGIDTLVHRTCIDNGGQTIAILGWGIYYKPLPPWFNLTSNLILSEWVADKPQLWMFPQRNRLVAGISSATLIVEAASESGSLITANWASKYHLPVLALPGPITSHVSVGTNELIRDQKAYIVTSVNDILSLLHLSPSTPPTPSISNPIIDLLTNQSLSADELSKLLHLKVELLLPQLSVLLLKGHIHEHDGKFSL